MAHPENEILGAIGRLTGIDGLSFDGDGFCALELGDEIPVALRNDGANHRVLLLAEAGRAAGLEAGVLGAIAGWNLQRASQPCPWLAWDEGESRLVLGEEIAHGEAPGMAERKFEAFMEALLGCRGFLGGGGFSGAPEGHEAAAVDWLRRC